MTEFRAPLDGDDGNGQNNPWTTDETERLDGRRSLRRALETRLRPHANTNRKLFGIGGGLGNLGPKIDIAFQLYMIDSQMRKAMEFDATSPAMTRAQKKLTLHEGKIFYPDHLGKDSDQPLEPVSSNEDRFRVNLQLALIWLLDDYQKHMMWSNVPLGFRYVPSPPDEPTP